MAARGSLVRGGLGAGEPRNEYRGSLRKTGGLGAEGPQIRVASSKDERSTPSREQTYEHSTRRWSLATLLSYSIRNVTSTTPEEASLQPVGLEPATSPSQLQQLLCLL